MNADKFFTVPKNILDIPDEILVKIISHFNARKRLALANSCTRFNRLVFEDKELLRDLDFSKKGQLTREADIQRYFNNKKMCKHILKVNIKHVKCMKLGKMLNNSIGKAINLVDVNIHGVKFKDAEQLGSFLQPLIHIRRLSIDWPESKTDDAAICHKTLQKTLSKVVYLSVKVFVFTNAFLATLQLCQELEELRIAPKKHPIRNRWQNNMNWSSEPNALKNLKILQVRGPYTMQLYRILLIMLADHQKWTDFQLVDMFRASGFYLEKNVEVCEELRKTGLMKSIPYQYIHSDCECGSFLISEYLLREVIKITHEDAPEKFCCLTQSGDKDIQSCRLKIDEAKRLLKNPEYQISFLHFNHYIEPDCDAHLLASAFPNLTDLVLSCIIKSKVSTSREKKHFKRRLRRRGSTVPEEQDDPTNLDSSFKMLVENTPNVKDLTVCSGIPCTDYCEPENWDLDSMNLIPRWKNLRALQLVGIPIIDGGFLVEIGKQCPKLEKIALYRLTKIGPRHYTENIPQMLGYCQNLTEFSINDDNAYEVPNVFTALSNNRKIKKVHLINRHEQRPSKNLISSVERLLHCCPKLTTFVFMMHGMLQNDAYELASALRRIIGELKRPDFQFQGPTLHMPNGFYEHAVPYFSDDTSDELL